MKPLKIIAIVLGVYIGIVVAFESLIGVIQPTAGETLVITTSDAPGSSHDRVLAHLTSDEKLYVAANHWPRAWYKRALEQPDVDVTIEGKTTARRAVPVSGDEHERVESDNGLPLAFRFVTGFPPRYFLRLDPR
ncbi:MAG: hypothetical protein JRG95_20760 [Deltaproteobacteria bacterium]|nr:hypothetical protein [Deltaproteobacteria bacterium]